MDRFVNIWEAKTQLSKLLEEVSRGNEFVIARRGEPIAKLVPIQRATREIGFADGLIRIGDDFDGPEEP